jgi:hypothetical protein
VELVKLKQFMLMEELEAPQQVLLEVAFCGFLLKL